MIPQPSPLTEYEAEPIGVGQSDRLELAGMQTLGPVANQRIGAPGDLATTAYGDLGPLQGDFVRARTTGAKGATRTSQDAYTALPSTRGGASDTFGEFSL